MMLGFMDYVQQAFYSSSNWDRDNSYGALTGTARALLEFPTPNGLRLNLSSLSSPNFATSYTLGSIGAVDGSLSYLYTSLPLLLPSTSNAIPLRTIVTGYRQLTDLRAPDQAWWWEIWHEGRRIDRRDTLLYGRLYLPSSHLEALYLRRLTPSTLLKISCVSSPTLSSSASMLLLLSRDVGKHSTEYLYSTDSALLGVRGLYNFGPDPRSLLPPSSQPPQTLTSNPLTPPVSAAVPSPKPIILNGRFSAGAELYYGLLNKSGGVSTGIRFATLPQHTGFPYTMTLTLNPLMGNLSCTYAARAGRDVALCSRLDFNVYSYESEIVLGGELWRRRKEEEVEGGVGWAKEKARSWGERMVGEKQGGVDEDTAGVLKARVDGNGGLGVLWEGRVKELLYSCGVVVDFKKREQIFTGVGLEVQYSS